MTRWLSIVGLGEDGPEGLSPAARALVGSARIVFGGARHLDLARPLIRGDERAWPSPLHVAFDEIARHAGEPVAVLATGDPFHYGVGKQLVERFGADAILCLPQPSAFSLAAARLGWSLQDAKIATLHGRALAGVIRHLQPGAQILALSWDESTPQKLAELLTERGFGRSRITVLEAMGGNRERVRSSLAARFDLNGIAPLNTVAIDCVGDRDARVLPYAPGLADSEFENDGQLTKREIRAVTIAALAPRHGELLWDIGLGAGSVAIEWLLRDPSLKAVGIEERPERAARAARNAAALGTPDLTIVNGRAPAALASLEPPDAVFIGGGFGDDGVFEAAWSALKPAGRLVVNAVSLESEQRLLDAYRRLGGDLVRIQISRAEPVGSMTGWKPALPVTQWRLAKP